MVATPEKSKYHMSKKVRGRSGAKRGSEMRIKALLAGMSLIFFVCGWSLCADMAVSYTSGDCTVDVDGTGTWVTASMSMELKEESLLRTGKDGRMEIEVHGEAVAIGSETIVSLRTFLENMESRDRLVWFDGFIERLCRMFSGAEQGLETASFGVRGDPVEGDELAWMDDSADLERDVEKGKEHFEQGEYGEAIGIFRLLIRDERYSSFHDQIAYYLGASLFNSLQYEEALIHLGESMGDREAYFHEAALIYYALACYLTGEYQRATDGFITFLEEFEEGELAPYAILMLGKSYKAAGDAERALSAFRDIEQHYEGTEVYDDAVAELRGL
jgi:tetratricopeptide (TPR) repeat protein